MPRAIWVKLQSDPNGSWTRYEGEPPFSIPVTGGLTYDVFTDSGDSFTLTPEAAAPVAAGLSGVPLVSGSAAVGQTLTATPAQTTGTEPITTTWQWLRDGADIPGETGISYVVTPSDAGASISVRQTATNAAGSDSATAAPVSVPVSPPVITALNASDQSPSGNVDLTYSIDRDSAVTGVITSAVTAPTAAQILAELDHTGAPAADGFTDTWTVAGSETLVDIADGIAAGTYYLHVLPAGGGDGDVVTSNGFALDTVPAPATGFTEQATTVASGTYLTDAGGALGATTYSQFLLFSSVITGQDANRAALIVWDDILGGLYSNIVSGDGAVGGSLRWQADGGERVTATDEVAALVDQRIHILASGWITAGGTTEVKLAIYDTNTGAWRTLVSASNVIPGQSFINFTDAMRIFQRSNGTNHDFVGTSFRQAMWVGTDTAEIADISQAAVQETFVNSATGTMIDPATAQAAYGSETLLFDYYTTAALNDGTPNAGTRTHTTTGAFT